MSPKKTLIPTYIKVLEKGLDYDPKVYKPERRSDFKKFYRMRLKWYFCNECYS